MLRDVPRSTFVSVGSALGGLKADLIAGEGDVFVAESLLGLVGLGHGKEEEEKERGQEEVGQERGQHLQGWCGAGFRVYGTGLPRS